MVWNVNTEACNALVHSAFGNRVLLKMKTISFFCEPAFEILLSLCMRSPNTYLAIYVFKGGCWGIEDAFLPFSTDYRKFQDPRLSCQSEG